jgi:RNA polymerase sigma-54 factor
MALSQRLDLRQSQSLVMTPQLQQAIKLLQLSNLELADYVEREIEQNPLLERDDSPDGSPEGGYDGEEAAQARDAGGIDAGAEDAGAVRRDAGLAGAEQASSDRLPADGDAPLDTDYGNVWTNSSLGDGAEGGVAGDWSGRGGRSDFADDEFSLDQVLSQEVSLREHLLSQINVELHDAADRMIGLALIELLDEAGWMTAELGPVADQLGVPAERVEAVLLRLQRFDPPGIFARSLRECLALQLRERDRLDPAMQAMIDNLDLLAVRNVPALLKVCGVDAEDLADMVAEIKTLDPKPALRFDAPVAQTVTPDILMRPHPAGGWLIELNSDTLPRVLVNRRYFSRITGEVRSKAERDYINERFHSANWLVKSLHQRATTILKVATEIVRQQDRFFAHGVQFLKPLILRDIAEAIGMHESTVSRVTTNKFMATPRGVFELKYFFTSAISGADGEASHSAESVRHRIKVLIDGEAADGVLSDDRIVEILRGDGIDIARRTVAKYREAMRIPSSVQRRREKSLRL